MKQFNWIHTYFQTKQSMEESYLARPAVTWKFAFAVCFGTGILMITPRAIIFAPKTLFTCKLIATIDMNETIIKSHRMIV